MKPSSAVRKSVVHDSLNCERNVNASLARTDPVPRQPQTAGDGQPGDNRMNVIAALFLTLSLDTSDYDKKQKGVITSLTKMGEASDKQAKVIAESGKKAAQSFSMLKIEVLGALAAFGMGDGLKSFIESSMGGQAALGRL